MVTWFEGLIIYTLNMKLTKEQVLQLFYFLDFLIDQDADVKQLKIRGGDIIITVEPVKGEFENRAWEINPDGKLEPVPSFFYD